MIDATAIKEYRQVIASKRWRDLRARLIRERGEQCERCYKTWAPGAKATVQLHHTTYERLGREADRDLLLVCAACHEHADTERAIESRHRADAALYNARLDGWLRKKYGEDYDFTDHTEEDRDAFNDWLDARRDDDY